jgi:hypothetical protein
VLTHKKKEYVDAYQLSVLTVEGLSLVETFASESEANSKLESLKYDYSLSEFSIIKVSKEVEPENLGEVKLDIPF